MRLLIYLLAMMTGFSAAEAARPVAAAPAAVAQAALIAASVASVEQEIAPLSLEKLPALTAVAVASVIRAMPAVAGSPVTRHDISRQ